MFEITSLCGQICLGKQGENLARMVYFDEPATWKETFGEGKCELLHQRNGDEAPYPVVLELENGRVCWKITNSDTAIVGDGKCELHYTVDGVVVKSKIWKTSVLESLGGEVAEAPEPYQGWVDEVLDAAEKIETEMADLVEETKELNEKTSGVVDAEAERVEAENIRQTNEQIRIDAEEQREILKGELETLKEDLEKVSEQAESNLEKVQTAAETVNNIVDVSVNLVNPSKKQKNSIIKTSTKTIDTPLDTHTTMSAVFVEVEPNKTYTTSPVTYRLFYYNAKGEYLSNIQADSGNKPYTITIPADVCYLGINFFTTYYDEFMVVEGEEFPTTYIPYGAKLKDELPLTPTQLDEVKKLTGKVCYISPNGNDNNEGSKESRFATFQKAVDVGASVIVAEGGTYRGQTLNIENVSSLHIYCESIISNTEKARIVFDNSESIVFDEKDSNNISVANVSKPTTSNWYKVFVSKTLTPVRSGLRSVSYNAILWEYIDENNARKLVPVLSYDECKITEGSFYYDHSAGLVYLNSDNVSSAVYKSLINEEGDTISATNVADLLFENVEVRYPANMGFILTKCNNVQMVYCDASHSAYGGGVRPYTSNVKCNRCAVSFVCADGFSASGGGYCEYNDCVAHHCGDDGVSCHPGCYGFVNGGEFSYCRKGGISPAENSKMDIMGAFCHNNRYGIQAESNQEVSGFKVRHSNCALYNNTECDYIVKNYHVLATNMKYTTKNVANNKNTSLTEI